MAGEDLIPTPLPTLKPCFLVGEVPIFPQKPTYAETIKITKETQMSLGPHATLNNSETKLSLLHKGSLQLKPLASHLGKCSVIFKKSDKAKLISRLNYVLIAKFSHGRPAIDSLHKFLLQSNIKGDYVLSVFDLKHVFIEFVVFEDFSRIWLKKNWVIQGFPVRFFKWSDAFMVSKESSIVPVWVHLPRLPLYLFEEESLLSIANAIGKPLYIDKANLNRTKLGYATFCVEMDVSKPPLDDLWIEFEDDSPSSKPEGFWQSIVYVDIPRFCVGCHHMGHSVEACKRRLDVEIDASDLVVMERGYTKEGAGWELKSVRQEVDLLSSQTGAELQTQGRSMQTKGVDHVVKEGLILGVNEGMTEQHPHKDLLGKGLERDQKLTQENCEITAEKNPAEYIAGHTAAGVMMVEEPAGEPAAEEFATGDSHAGEIDTRDSGVLGLLAGIHTAILEHTDVNNLQNGAGNSPRNNAAGMLVSFEQPGVFAGVERSADAREAEQQNCTSSLQPLEVGIIEENAARTVAGNISGINAAGVQIGSVEVKGTVFDLMDKQTKSGHVEQETLAAGEPVEQEVMEAGAGTKISLAMEHDTGNVASTRPENETFMQQLRRINREEKAKKSAEKKAKKATLKLLCKQMGTGPDAVATQSQVSTDSGAVLVEEEDKQEAHAGVEKVDSKQEDVAKQNMSVKLNSAAEPFSPAASSAGQRKGAEMGMMGTPGQIGGKADAVGNELQIVTGNIDFSAFKARMYRLTGKAQYLAKEDNKEERNRIVSHLSFSEDIEDGYDEESEEGDLDERVGSQMLHGKSFLSDEMSDIPRPFKIKSAPNSPKGRNSSYDSNTYLLSRGYF